MFNKYVFSLRTTMVLIFTFYRYEGVPKSFWTGRLERELKMVHLSATRSSCTPILCVSLVSFVAITLCVASQRVFIVVNAYFVIDSVRKRLDSPSYESDSGLRQIVTRPEPRYLNQYSD
jgi:hypothetical protein